MSPDRLYDFSGWDLPKFLRYLNGLNLSVVEWSTSPIVYIDTQDFGARVSDFVQQNTAYRLLIPAHRGMLLSNKACGLESVKRAMYVARSLLALHVLLVGKRMPRDFTWGELMTEAALPEAERGILDRLHALKVASKEKSAELPDDIKAYLSAEMDRYRNMELPSVRGVEVTAEEKALLVGLWNDY